MNKNLPFEPIKSNNQKLNHESLFTLSSNIKENEENKSNFEKN